MNAHPGLYRRSYEYSVQATSARCRLAVVAVAGIVAMVLATASLAASAATLTVKANRDVEEDDSLRILIEGSISSRDVVEIKAVLAKYPRHTPRVALDSNGGDIEAAMAIGRALRVRDASVSVGMPPRKCYSSCVLIYAAGVERENYGDLVEKYRHLEAGGSGIGIHRFYFSHLSASATTADIQAARNKQKERIRSYLSDMNVSTQLLDAMEATPPEAMRMLTLKELRSFGLVARDPVYDEKVVAGRAAYFGLTSSEYRKRSVEAKDYCSTQSFAKKPNLPKKGLPDIDFDSLLNCEPDYIKSGRPSR